MLLQLPGACAASSELLSSLLLPRLGEGAGLDPLSQPDSLPKGWSHFPRSYKCKRRSGECNPSSNHGMQRKQEPEVVWWRQHVQGLSWLWAEGLPLSLLALTRVALQRSWPMEIRFQFLSRCHCLFPRQHLASSQFPSGVSGLGCHILSSAYIDVFVSEQWELHF